MRPPITEKQARSHPVVDALIELMGNTVERLMMERDALSAELELARMKTYCASISEIAANRDVIQKLYAEHVECLYEVSLERDALKADAERYRWLRDVGGNKIMRRIENILDSELWNAAIDAAMKE